MIKILKNSKDINFKPKMGNILMISGKKNTSEKVLLKFAKRLQKSTSKNFKNVVQTAIINTTPTFKLNEQVVKKGKRKAIKTVPSFLTNDFSRVTMSFKLLRDIASKTQKSNNFYKSLANEVLTSSMLEGQSVEKKNELQRQVLLNKRYLSKFRW